MSPKQLRDQARKLVKMTSGDTFEERIASLSDPRNNTAMNDRRALYTTGFGLAAAAAKIDGVFYQALRRLTPAEVVKLVSEAVEDTLLFQSSEHDVSNWLRAQRVLYVIPVAEVVAPENAPRAPFHYLLTRPAMYGTVPPGFADEGETVISETHWHTVAYNAPVSEEDRVRFEMRPADVATVRAHFPIGAPVHNFDGDPGTVLEVVDVDTVYYLMDGDSPDNYVIDSPRRLRVVSDATELFPDLLNLDIDPDNDPLDYGSADPAEDEDAPSGQNNPYQTPDFIAQAAETDARMDAESAALPESAFQERVRSLSKRYVLLNGDGQAIGACDDPEIMVELLSRGEIQRSLTLSLCVDGQRQDHWQWLETMGGTPPPFPRLSGMSLPFSVKGPAVNSFKAARKPAPLDSLALSLAALNVRVSALEEQMQSLIASLEMTTGQPFL